MLLVTAASPGRGGKRDLSCIRDWARTNLRPFSTTNGRFPDVPRQAPAITYGVLS
jgi:hypothetical protein